MQISQYNAYDQKLNEIVSLVSLTNEEWFEFIKIIVNGNLYGINNEKINNNEIEQIDINFCAPFCSNGSVFSSYQVDTKFLSIISGEIGNYSLRLWLGEHGIRSSLMDVDNILGSNPTDLYTKFNQWWRKIPLEPQIIDDTIMSKRTKEYGVNHVQIWLKSLDKDKPTSAVDRFLKEIKLWVFAYELIMYWSDHKSNL